MWKTNSSALFFSNELLLFNIYAKWDAFPIDTPAAF